MLESLLAVTSHPSPLLSVDEFHDWYEKEHIPLRLNFLKDFLSGARYRVCSLRPDQTLEDEQQTPQDDENSTSSWLALYTLTSSAVFSSSAYTDLRTNRSDREKNVMSRIKELTRLTGDVVDVWCHDEVKTTGFTPGRPSEWVVTHRLRIRDQDGAVDRKIKSWAPHIRDWQAKDGSGWARTRLVRVLETGVSHFGVSVNATGADKEIDMPYYAVHGEYNFIPCNSHMLIYCHRIH